MKQERRFFITLKAATLALLVESYAFAAAPLTYSGVFPAGHENTDCRTYNMLVDKPKRLLFAISDEKGAALSKVKVVAVTPASTDGGVNNPAGIKQADLTEPGIYDVKVAIDPDVTGEVGFILKVTENGEAPTQGTIPASQVSPGSGSNASASAVHAAPVSPSVPVAPVAPAGLVAPVVSETSVTPAASTTFVTPGIPAPPGTPETKTIHAAQTASGTPKGQSNSPVQTKLPVEVPSVPIASSGESPVKQHSENTITPLITTGSLGAIVSRYPGGPGYADPYKPVEIIFEHDIPGSLVLSKVVQLTLRTTGGEKQVEGQYFPAGRNGIRFLPKKLMPGAVYIVRVFDPATGNRIDEFTFPTFPTVRLSLSVAEDGYQAELVWPALPELLPVPEAQSVKLNACELVFLEGSREVARFACTNDLAPFGSIDDLRYQGRPFGLTLSLPASRFSPSARFPNQPVSGNASSGGVASSIATDKFVGLITVALFVRISGRDGQLEVARASLSSRLSSSATFPTNFVGMPTVSIPGIASSVAGTASPAGLTRPSVVDSVASAVLMAPPIILASVSSTLPQIAQHATAPESIVQASPSAPVTVTLSSSASEPVTVAETVPETVPETVVQKPVTPIANPGPAVTVVPELDFTVTEGATSAVISWPRGCLWGPDGSLWVVDSQNRRVMRFNDEGRLMHAFGKKGKGPGMLGLPIDIAISADGIFISDTATHTIHLFDMRGTYLKSIGSWGTKPGQIDLPHGLDIAEDQLWVAERGNAQIMRFGLDGVYKGSFGKRGELPGYFENPVAVHVHNGTVWVLEPGQGRLQRFSKEGKYQGGFIAGTKDACDMTIDPWGYPWVADSEGRRVIRYDQNGKLLLTIESPIGGRPWSPTSLSIRADGLLAIGDGNNRSIRIFRINKTK
ncbi:MAG: hypothetical protein HQM09_04660 [Candidatus Riflebacteria bacterium]|nr:hypothetical protein [Candidatus Riflebacteria bacterium]